MNKNDTLEVLNEAYALYNDTRLTEAGESNRTHIKAVLNVVSGYLESAGFDVITSDTSITVKNNAGVTETYIMRSRPVPQFIISNSIYGDAIQYFKESKSIEDIITDFITLIKSDMNDELDVK